MNFTIWQYSIEIENASKWKRSIRYGFRLTKPESTVFLYAIDARVNTRIGIIVRK